MRTKLEPIREGYPGQHQPLRIDDWHRAWQTRREISLKNARGNIAPATICRLERVSFVDGLPLDFVVSVFVNRHVVPKEFGIFFGTEPPQMDTYPFPVLWMQEGGMQPYEAKWIRGKKFLG